MTRKAYRVAGRGGKYRYFDTVAEATSYCEQVRQRDGVILAVTATPDRDRSKTNTHSASGSEQPTNTRFTRHQIVRFKSTRIPARVLSWDATFGQWVVEAFGGNWNKVVFAGDSDIEADPGSQPTKHVLVIHSFSDAQAICLCGNWTYTATGKRSRAEIEHEFNLHINTQLPDGHTSQAHELKDVLLKLIAWEAYMGGFDSPVWSRAKRLAEAIPQHEGTFADVVYHDGKPAHHVDRITDSARQSSFNWCARCNAWFEPSKLAITSELTHAECATVLAALRVFQGAYNGLDFANMEHFEEGTKPLTVEEIDALCEKINLEPITVERERCAVTHNPCGTDTWMAGRPCQCAPCQRYIAAGGKPDNRHFPRKPDTELARLIAKLERAFDGDSNDAEHDAAFALVEYLKARS